MKASLLVEAGVPVVPEAALSLVLLALFPADGADFVGVCIMSYFSSSPWHPLIAAALLSVPLVDTQWLGAAAVSSPDDLLCWYISLSLSREYVKVKKIMLAKWCLSVNCFSQNSNKYVKPSQETSELARPD